MPYGKNRIRLPTSSGAVLRGNSLWNPEALRGTAEARLRRTNEELQHRIEKLAKREATLTALVRKQRAELTETTQGLRHLSFKLLTAQEAERKRISRELHDELGGSLSALKIGLCQLERGLPEDQVDLRERCSDSLKTIDRIIDDVHRLSRDLSPHLVEEFGLSTALENLIEKFGSTFSGMKVSANVLSLERIVSRVKQVAIYRMVQECLTNVAKHSEARNVSLSMERQNDRVYIVVEDDGKGFVSPQVVTRESAKRGMGLVIMNERVRMLGGALHLYSEEGKGTRIAFQIPVRKVIDDR